MSSENQIVSCDLRVGYIASFYYRDVQKSRIPGQLTILHELYPGLLVELIPSDENQKQDAVYDDISGMIRASFYHGKLYAGGSSRISQITARLTGTARSGIEKERRTAANIQIRIAGQLCEDPDLLISFWNAHQSRFANWPEEKIERIVTSIFDYIEKLLLHDFSSDELFPMDSEVAAELMSRMINRLYTDSEEGFLDAWIWLLLGALLRNEIRRLLYCYRADFSLISENSLSPSSEAIDTENKDYEYYYEGDDMEKRFPGIEWYCDRCGERLDTQEGFHDFVHVWKCTNCGFKNRIEVDEIYDTETDYQAGNTPMDRKEFFRALKIRTDELDNQT